MAVFLHKFILAIVKIENKKYTSLVNHIASLVVPIVYHHMRTKVKSHEDKNQKYVCKNQKSTHYCDDKITIVSQSAQKIH